MHDDGLACGKCARPRAFSISLSLCVILFHISLSRVHSGASRASALRILKRIKVRGSIFRFASVNPDGADL
jgi:hypothetical protein